MSMTVFWKYFFPPLYALLIYSNIRLVNDLVDKNDKFWERPWTDTFSEITACILFSYVFVYAVLVLADQVKAFPIHGNLDLRSNLIILSIIYCYAFVLVHLHLHKVYAR